MGRKKNNGAGPIVSEPAIAPADTTAQEQEKLKKIRAARRVVKRHEIEIGRLRDELKLAKEERDGAQRELNLLIEDSPQAEFMFDSATGEVNGDRDPDEEKHDGVQVSLTAGGRTVNTTLGKMKRATRKLEES